MYENDVTVAPFPYFKQNISPIQNRCNALLTVCLVRLSGFLVVRLSSCTHALFCCTFSSRV